MMMVKNRRLYLVACIFLLLGFGLGLFSKQNILSKNIDTSTTPSIESEPSDGKMLDCDQGCPKYQTMSVKGYNGSYQTVIRVPTSMSHAAAKVLVVDKGKIIFDSGELPGLVVHEDPKSEGFYLEYTPDIYTTETKTVYYKYINGDFVLQ